ncbi:di-heme enzyme [Solirubrobacter taibaiensis]|nr:di-heme enzyme [Solirubrobacter taibaiensis]
MSRARRWSLTLVGIATAAFVVQSMASASAPREYRWELPKGFPKPNVPSNNPMSAAKVAVGRRLFYDVRLSGNGTQSCGSCHRQELAFTDGKAQAIGSTGQAHPRGAQSLINVVYNSTLTWANPSLVTLERQMEVPLFSADPVEMGVTDANKDQVLRRILKDPWYKARFQKAFPGQKQPITWSTIIKSIASFQRSLVSADSRYDRYLTGKERFTAAEKRGMELFMGERAECHHCHGSFIFNDQVTYKGSPNVKPLFHNTGLYNLGGTGAFPEPNRGVFELTGVAKDMGAFKAPSLRNVGVTAPYMHDGSVPTLEAAVEHYAGAGRNITDGPLAGDGRANPYKDPLITQIELTAGDKADLVAFLKTLTDRRVLTDKRFSDPFKR